MAEKWSKWMLRMHTPGVCYHKVSKYNFDLVNRKLLQVLVTMPMPVQRFGDYRTLTLLKILFYQKSQANKAINKFWNWQISSALEIKIFSIIHNPQWSWDQMIIGDWIL